MNGRINKKMLLLAIFLCGGVFAASAGAAPPAPWFLPGGARPIPQGNRDWAQSAAQSRALYGEQRFIRHLYQGYLSRQPSSAELRFWSDRLGRDANPTDLVREFMDSDEFFIRETYRGLLHREPDSSGMDTFMRMLRDGRSRADVVESLLVSEEFRQNLR